MCSVELIGTDPALLDGLARRVVHVAHVEQQLHAITACTGTGERVFAPGCCAGSAVVDALAVEGGMGQLHKPQ